ncbi:beta strand repeat-containing protein [Hoeflea olei]|uniref:Autotransporter domain-containing protein n=1 Tax=Hoeflea olei TaxID=1480615 RepID=A0A1C1Z1A0_9HYPH|nr:Ig-like domain repeat protein [Hoeflea olei]OCW59542.1 hypothetical protein AWJ14_11055 [Hoeflea olei]
MTYFNFDMKKLGLSMKTERKALSRLAMAAAIVVLGAHPALARSAGCTQMMADFNSSMTPASSLEKSYAASSFDPSEEAKFTIVMGPEPDLGEFEVAGQGGTPQYILNIDNTTYQTGSASTVITGTQLTTTGLRIRLEGYQLSTGGLWVVAADCGVDGPPPPSITSQPSNSSVSIGGTTSFSIAASDATAYKWQVNSGSSWTDLADNATYSGTTTTTLSLTGVSLAMNGYQYRAIATGAATPDATSNAATLTVNKATPSVSIASSSTTPVFGTSVTFTATLSGGLSPSGTVTFKDGATTLGTGTISGTTATYSTAALAAGNHSVTAEYGGDAQNATATSAPVAVTVGKVTPTISVASSDTAPAFGTSVTLTATLAGGASPSGTVTFKDGATTLGTGTISGTTATYSTAGLAVGSHSITAEYAGDTNNATATSAAVTITVAKVEPTISVSASDAAPAFGASVTLTATLAGGASPSGTVTFKDGATTLGTGTISGTTATYSTAALAVGSHTITAEYVGDANNLSAVSASTTVTVAKATPTLTVSPSTATPAFGASVTFTATFADSSAPTGTVTFKDGSTTLGTGTISGTSATYSTSALSVGSHSITAEYAGDTDNAPASSTSVAVTVAKAVPTLSVTSSNIAPSFGTSVTLTATLANGSAPTGTVTFKDGAATLGTGTISGTTATYSTSALSVGNHSITADYAGDADNEAAASSALTISVGKIAPTIALTASDATPALGASVTFTATLGGGASPSGTVTFKDGATTLGTGTISGTTATFATSALAVGSHSITADYAGDANNGASSSQPLAVTVMKLTPTIALTVSDANPALGASVTFTATLAGGASPSGTVTFKDGATTLGTGTISGTTATFSTAALAAGSHAVTADYAGDADNEAVSSSSVTVTVSKLTPTIALAVSDANPVLGASVTFTATLAGGASPSGTVTFKDGTTTLGTGAISGTTATLSTAALAAGSHAITADYAGDANNEAATSSPVTVAVDKLVPTIALTVSDANPQQGTSVTFTATLAGGASPSGTVTFKDGTTTLGTGTITGTTATFATAALSVGNHAVTADYAGDANNEAASSSPVSVTVEQTVSFTFAPSTGSLGDAMAGEEYRQSLSVTGGTAPLVFSIVSGTLPDGLVLNVSTGELSGRLSPDTELKLYSFTIGVRDNTGATGEAAYTLRVVEQKVTVVDKQQTVPAGSSPLNVDLAQGATGGPFISADIVTVSPPDAGTATIVNGEFAAAGGATPIGWYLKFTPNPSYSGQVKVQYRLTSTLGVSNTGTVTYLLSFDPAQVSSDIDQHVRGFVETRQGLIASSIEIPGLLERRAMAGANSPVTARVMPSGDSMSASFATSLAQMRGAGSDGTATATGPGLSPFNVWVDGKLILHNRDQNDGRWGEFGLVSAGVDYLLTDRALIGVSVHYDHMTDPTDADARLTGNGWLAGPYASLELGTGVFWDTSLLYGGSSNTIDSAFWDGSFDTRRWLFDTSIKGQWRLDAATTLTPRLRAVYFSETVDDYAVANSAGNSLVIQGFTTEQLRVSLGAELARRFTLDNGMTMTAKLGLTGGLSGLDNATGFGQTTAGLSLEMPESWNLDFGLLFGLEDEGRTSAGAKLGLRTRF